MTQTKIPWATKVWNPVTGCTFGCKYCYARPFANRLKSNPKMGDTYKNGFNPTFHPERCTPEYMKRYKKGDFVFVCSMGDLFDPEITHEQRLKVFEAVTYSKANFMFLTKRADMLLEFFKSIEDFIPEEWENCWFGVSVTNQKDADERLPLLDYIPSIHKFVSIEPLTDAVDLGKHIFGEWSNLDWVIVGGETGHNAQPLHPDWVRSIRDQCEFYLVPFFFKGWGEWGPYHVGGRGTKEFNWCERGESFQWMCKVGKKQSGDFLNEKQHHEFPKI